MGYSKGVGHGCDASRKHTRFPQISSPPPMPPADLLLIAQPGSADPKLLCWGDLDGRAWELSRASPVHSVEMGHLV